MTWLLDIQYYPLSMFLPQWRVQASHPYTTTDTVTLINDMLIFRFSNRRQETTRFSTEWYKTLRTTALKFFVNVIMMGYCLSKLSELCCTLE